MYYSRCIKCLKPKRKNTKEICVVCKNEKNFRLSSKLTDEDVYRLKDEVKKIKYKFEVTQCGLIDLWNINEIIELHDQIFDIEYIGSNLRSGEQLDLMWKNINKFLTL